MDKTISQLFREFLNLSSPLFLDREVYFLYLDNIIKKLVDNDGEPINEIIVHENCLLILTDLNKAIHIKSCY